jgi:SAM-dependent methyltransferase
MTMTITLEKPDYTTIKSRQQAIWSSGDYAVIGTTLQIVGETLCEAVDLCAGERVLDVASGNGNATLAAARRFAEVTSTDYVGDLLDRGKERARAERLPIAFRLADAEALPFADSSFDVALSVFGVMFTPDQQQAAAELVRVVRKGGRIALANWTPDGFIGQLFKTIGRHLPPPRRSQVTGAMGHRIASGRAVSGPSGFGGKAGFQLSLSLGRPLARCLQDILWAGAPGLCIA